ncbi:hypothetical protein Pmani_020571 [Petrolisthes manimaculis]|uniref:Peroxisomal ATPase PEX6 n=1 Tax=Petrolisthes manimaculis TaxID=1843537 RepID=A0AAE1PIA6_9EUCA|nr:hypothetical protein Pmani_020571 [Petrolisthes manimaculis]
MLHEQRRWIRVIVSHGVEDHISLVSPVLYHNVHQGGCHVKCDVLIEFNDNDISDYSEPVRRIVLLWNNVQDYDACSDFSTNHQQSPDVAAEVYVKAIESVKYRCGGELESLLKDYFRTPKVIAVGDVIALPISKHRAHELTPGSSIIPPKHVFIMVTQVWVKTGAETKQCVQVSAGVTDLYLSGSTNCLLPVMYEKFDAQGVIESPPLLKDTVGRVKIILQSNVSKRKQALLTQNNSINSGPTLKEVRKQRNLVRLNGKRDNREEKRGEKELSSTTIQQHISSVTLLLLGPPGSGKKQVIKLAASSLGLGVVWANCWQLKGDTSGGTEAKLRQMFIRASAMGPCILALLNIHCLSNDRDGREDVRVVATLRESVEKLSQLDRLVLLVATAPDRKYISDDLWSVWSYQEEMGVPDLSQRMAMLTWLLSQTSIALKATEKPQIHPLSQRTAGYALGDFDALFNMARRQCLVRLADCEAELDKETGAEEESTVWDKRQPIVTHPDLLKALDELQAGRSEALGAPRIPQVRWDEVGGLEEAKKEIVNTIQLPLRHPALVSSKLRRSGVLLYGPPGTGKTLLAKAVATECGLNFMSVKGPELLNMYVGQSEENVRQVFSQAKAAAPCVIFFDELDSLAPNRGRSGDSGGVMDRIVSALLAELDGVASGADVFVLAATNRPDLLDPALLRPGRFEKMVFLGVCEDRAGQVKILKAVTSKMPLAPSVSLHHISRLLPLTLTGADLHALCSDALYSALRRTISHISTRNGELDGANEFKVEEMDFKSALKNLVPSVTSSDLAHYRSLKEKTER